MLKNRFLAAFALAGLVAFTACEAEEEAGIVEEGAVAEEAVVEPVAPAPVVTEPVVAPEAGAATEILGNGIDDDGDGLIDEEV